MEFKARKIDESENSSFLILESGDFEYQNPYSYYEGLHMSSTMTFANPLIRDKFPNATEQSIQNALLKLATKEWLEKLENYRQQVIPDSLKGLLTAKTKKNQVKLLKGLEIKMDQLISFFFHSFDKYGFSLSQYRAQHHHSGLDESDLPKLFYLNEDDSIKTIGATNLKPGQLKQVIKHRSIKVSRFLDCNDQWHCFFLTMKSVKGKENYKDGQPHIHYISDKWNLSRDEVLKQLTNKKYSLPALPHIELTKE